MLSVSFPVSWRRRSLPADATCPLLAASRPRAAPPRRGLQVPPLVASFESSRSFAEEVSLDDLIHRALELPLNRGFDRADIRRAGGQFERSIHLVVDQNVG